jgi:predicted acyltransferase (DUF342 family)
VQLDGTLTLNGNGSSDGEWVFQIATTLVLGTSSNVILTGGAKASNIWWIVGSSATFGTYSHLEGNVLASASVAAETGATVNGGLYAGAGITFDANTVNVQTPAAKKARQLVGSAKFLGV